eukprot:7364267-Heterocapsa_arctica.AAC.1
MTRTQHLGKQPFPEHLQDIVQLVREAQAASGAAVGRAHQREEAGERKAAEVPHAMALLVLVLDAAVA